MVAMPTASIVKARLGSNGMRHGLGGSRAAPLMWIKPAFSVAEPFPGLERDVWMRAQPQDQSFRLGLWSSRSGTLGIKHDPALMFYLKSSRGCKDGGGQRVGAVGRAHRYLAASRHRALPGPNSPVGIVADQQMPP